MRKSFGALGGLPNRDLENDTIKLIQAEAPKDNVFNPKTIMALVGGWMIVLVPGTILALGSMNVYMLSYYHESQHYKVNADLFNRMLPLVYIFSMMCYPVGNFLVDFFHGQSRPVIMIAAFIGLSMQLSCSLITYHPNTFIFVWCSSMGLQRGCYYSACYRAAWSHLPNHKGLATGIIASGAGVGSAIFGMFFQKMANPDSVKPYLDTSDGNYYFPKVIGDQYPNVQFKLCVVWLLLILVGLSLINNKEAPVGGQLTIMVEDGSSQTPREVVVNYEQDVNFSRVIFSEQFIKLFVMAWCHFIYIMFFLETFKEIGQEYISDEILTFIGSMGGLSISAMRILGGILLDRVSFKSIYMGLATMLMLQILTVSLTVKVPGLYALSCVVIMSLEGILTVTAPAICLITFGMVRGPAVFGVM